MKKLTQYTTNKTRYIAMLTLLFLTAAAFAQAGKSGRFNIDEYRKSYWDHLPKPNGWVNDFEGLYTDEEERSLDSIISIFKGETEIQIAIVTLDTLVTSKEKFDALTLHMANTWGVGEKGKDNGILIGISKGHRSIRIQNGYGIEKLITDDETKKVIDAWIIPAFRKGEYYSGTQNGVVALIELLHTKVK